MITGEIKNKVDRMWEYFWTGGLTNPVDVIEQLTYLIFMKRLDQEEQRKKKKNNLQVFLEILMKNLFLMRIIKTLDGVILFN